MRQLLPILLLLTTTALGAQPSGTTLQSQIDALFTEWRQADHPGGVVGIVKRGEVVLARAYGLASLEYGAPNTTDTRFNVASVSKQFTAFSLVLLQQDGKLDLDDPVQKYLPELPDFGPEITLRHLLNHTSGLRNFQNLLTMAGWREGDHMTNDDLLRYIQHQEDLNFKPGAEYLYCNTGYNLSAEIVERLSGMSFLEFTQKRIFQPLGMTNSGFREDVEAVHQQTATSYDAQPDGTFKRPKPFWTYVGNGNLYTTIDDLAKWLDNFRSGKVGGPEAIDALTTRGILNSGDTISYALGLVVNDYRGLPRIQHGGSIGGYRSNLTYYPEQETGIIIMSNFSEGNPSEKARRVADAYLADAFPQPKPEREEQNPSIPREPIDLAPEDFDPLAGMYFITLDDGMLIRLFRDGEQFKAEQIGGPTFPIQATSDSTFIVPGTPNRFIAHRETDGTANRLTIFHPQRETGRRLDPELLKPDYLQTLAGAYYSPELDTRYELTFRDGQLIAKHRRQESFTLMPIEKDRLQASAWYFSDVKIQRDADGRVEGLLVSNGRVRDLWFELE